MKCLEYSSPSWARSVFANDQAIKWAKAKVCVYADLALCVGQMRDTPDAIERWKGQVERLKLHSSHQDATNFPGFSSLSMLQEIQKDLAGKNIQSEEFKDRIIFMSMFNDIGWKTNDENSISNAEQVKHYAMRFSQGHWTFLGVGSGEKRSVMAILLMLKKGSGIVQLTKWCNHSKKLFISYSKVSVL